MTEETPDILVFVVREKLSDGSIVWNVELEKITIHAVTQEDAEDLAEAIALAINEHSVNTAETILP